MNVVVYSKMRCPQCVKVKQELTLKGVIYTEVLVDTNPEAHKFLVERGHRSVPVVYVDGVHVDPKIVTAEEINWQD